MKNKKRKIIKNCTICSECVYICDGDFACMAYKPVVVMEDFNMPTDDYFYCGGKYWEYDN